MRFIQLIFRIISNPRFYWKNLPYKFFGTKCVVSLYRRFILPIVVWRVRRHKVVNILFLAMNPDMWRYQGVYDRMARDPRFHPIIVTAMRKIDDFNLSLEEQESMVRFFSGRGMPVVRGYDTSRKKWINLRSLRPDLIFYTQPYDEGIAKELEYYHYLDALICYAPYSFQLTETKWGWDNTLQLYCWRQFLVSKYHLQVSERLSRIRGVNAVPVGYCFEEEYDECVHDRKEANLAWKNDERKRIIWAPHHSIAAKELFKVSSFLDIADAMLSIKERFADRVVFAFKPHPVLKTKLYDIWGRSRTDDYYERWASSSNSFETSGDYHALFAGSDAMIHCSGSFIIEYMYTNKPVQYVYSKTRNPPDLGVVGDSALEAHYGAVNATDIISFIQKVVLEGVDTKRIKREQFLKNYIKSPQGSHFSENVYCDIVKGLGR